jgi:hypothetical protein
VLGTAFGTTLSETFVHRCLATARNRRLLLKRSADSLEIFRRLREPAGAAGVDD